MIADRAGSAGAGAGAASVYRVSIEPPGPGRPRLRAVVRTVMLGVAAMTGWYDEPTSGDLVVRRRDDGREVLRVDAGTSEEAAGLLAHVREQLDAMTARQFRDTWDVVDPGLGPSVPGGAA